MILGIDTSTSVCSVALWDGKNFVEWEQRNPTGHSSVLMPMMKRAFDEVEGAVDTLVVSRGPGSFTGVRIGVSTALGLQFSGKLKVYSVSSLQARSYLDGFEGVRLPIIDARRERVYGACYGALQHEEVNAPFVHFLELLSGTDAPVALIGESIDHFYEMARAALLQEVTINDTQGNAKGAIRAFLEGKYERDLYPVYLREVEAVRRRKEKEDADIGD
jgi:tRNA threonylcarbamoyladenosine biosynthesis protein TsaB